jgi:ADP-ribose pyrophosphatase YjhB (NUDIX family)
LTSLLLRPANHMVDPRTLEALEASIGDPRRGLPEDLFLLVSRITPLVNVDLLIRVEDKGTLLTWRDDAHYGAGWHLAGGVIRFQETALDRVREVARLELGADVTPHPEPELVHESIDRRMRTRGHFISLLFRCSLRSGPDPALEALTDTPLRGQWRWHRTCPENLLPVHQAYRKFLI